MSIALWCHISTLKFFSLLNQLVLSKLNNVKIVITARGTLKPSCLINYNVGFWAGWGIELGLLRGTGELIWEGPNLETGSWGPGSEKPGSYYRSKLAHGATKAYEDTGGQNEGKPETLGDKNKLYHCFSREGSRGRGTWVPDDENLCQREHPAERRPQKQPQFSTDGMEGTWTAAGQGSRRKEELGGCVRS